MKATPHRQYLEVAMRRFSSVLGLVLFAVVGCASDQRHTGTTQEQSEQPVWNPPPDSTASLVASLEQERDSEGAVVFKGRVLLPPGTVVWLTVKPSGRKPLDPAKVRLGADGSFISEGITDNGVTLKPGRYKIEVLSYFNTVWQSQDVLHLIGEGGAKLPKRALTPEDKEFPLAAGRLEETRTVVLPDLAAQLVALEAVKNARLSTPEKGRSADPIKGVIDLYESAYRKTNPDAFRATGWSAEQVANGKWVVTMDYLDAHKPKQCRWEYDPATKKVKYLDPAAKMFSWSPAE